MKVGDIGEFLLIEKLLKILGKDPNEILGYDDVSAIAMDGKFLVIKTDMFVESADRWPDMPFFSIGWKSLVMNVSDFAAKGVKPIGGLVSLGIPEDLRVSDVMELYEGMSKACREYGFYIWGGDMSSAKEVIVAPMLVGFSERILKRRGAKPGDVLVATGVFGYTSIAYKVFFQNYKVENREIWKKTLDAIFYPKVALDFGVEISERGLANSGIDCSDGLAWTLHEIAKASRVKVVLEEIPVPGEVYSQLETWGLDPLHSVLYEGGEEYVSIYSIKQEALREVFSLAEEKNVELYVIGRIERGRGVYLKEKRGLVEVKPLGWNHFRRGSTH